MRVNTENMCRLSIEINRLGTPAHLTVTDTTTGPEFHIAVGATYLADGGATEVHEVLISGDTTSTPGDPGSLVYGVYDQDWRAVYVDTDTDTSTPTELAGKVVKYHADMITAGAYAPSIPPHTITPGGTK